MIYYYFATSATFVVMARNLSRSQPAGRQATMALRSPEDLSLVFQARNSSGVILPSPLVSAWQSTMVHKTSASSMECQDGAPGTFRNSTWNKRISAKLIYVQAEGPNMFGKCSNLQMITLVIIPFPSGSHPWHCSPPDTREVMVTSSITRTVSFIFTGQTFNLNCLDVWLSPRNTNLPITLDICAHHLLPNSSIVASNCPYYYENIWVGENFWSGENVKIWVQDSRFNFLEFRF